MNLSNTYHKAALMLFVSAALHLVVILLSGSTYLAPMLGGFVLWALIGYGMMGERRWLAYVAFLGALCGAIFALGFGMNALGLTRFVFFGITIADICVAILTFGILWRSKSLGNA